MALRTEGHGDSQGGLPDEQSIETYHIYVTFGLRPPIYTLYRLNYLHMRGMLFWSREHQCAMTLYMPSVAQLPR